MNNITKEVLAEKWWNKLDIDDQRTYCSIIGKKVTTINIQEVTNLFDEYSEADELIN